MQCLFVEEKYCKLHEIMCTGKCKDYEDDLSDTELSNEKIAPTKKEKIYENIRGQEGR